jgi:hypothetical protein
MKIKAWVSANNQQSNTPTELVRVLILQVAPVVPGGNVNIAAGKMGGQLQLSNVTEAFAAQFAGGAMVDIEITPATA